MHTCSVGSLVVSVPQDLLIHGGTAGSSDLGRAIAATGTDSDTLKLLWSCVERHEPNSQHAAFWQSLPPRIDTGQHHKVHHAWRLRTSVVQTLMN